MAPLKRHRKTEYAGTGGPAGKSPTFLTNNPANRWKEGGTPQPTRHRTSHRCPFSGQTHGRSSPLQGTTHFGSGTKEAWDEFA